MKTQAYWFRRKAIARAVIFFFVAVCWAMAAQLAAADQTEADRAAVLAANSEFYRAFRESDMAAMVDIWGKVEPIIVEHPSSWREEGRAKVLSSWAVIMRSPPTIYCQVEDLFIANGLATVYCLEQLNPGEVRMVNRFHQEDGVWRLIFHGPAEDHLT
ncbi:MAG: nuclear transport factor 2 family protein [Pseudomonadota bacterium]